MAGKCLLSNTTTIPYHDSGSGVVLVTLNEQELSLLKMRHEAYLRAKADDSTLVEWTFCDFTDVKPVTQAAVFEALAEMASEGFVEDAELSFGEDGFVDLSPYACDPSPVDGDVEYVESRVTDDGVYFHCYIDDYPVTTQTFPPDTLWSAK